MIIGRIIFGASTVVVSNDKPEWAENLKKCRQEIIRLRLKADEPVVKDSDPVEITTAEYGVYLKEHGANSHN